MTLYLGCQGNIIEVMPAKKKNNNLDLLLHPGTSGGMRSASQKGMKIAGGKGREKMVGRAVTAARSTCQETLEKALHRQMLCHLALCCPAKRSELTNHFSLSCGEQQAKAQREIKTLRNASSQGRKSMRGDRKEER